MHADSNSRDTDASAGIFSWDIHNNLVYADRAAAALFGILTDEAAQGLPIERFLDRVHPEDQENLRDAISQAMLTSEPFQLHYRTQPASRHWESIVAFGHCFRSEEGGAHLFSGILHSLPQEQDGGTALWHLIAAHQIFEQEDHVDEARMVLRVLQRILHPSESPAKIVRLHARDDA